MLLNTRKFLLGFALSLMLLPMMAFASTEFKGTETVNINKADAATLAAYLKGVGANKAEAIVKYRKSNGKFKTAADIKNVPGVGEATYKDMKSKISTSRGKSKAPEGYKLADTSGKSSSSKKKSSSKKSSSSSSKSKSSSSDKKSSSSKSKDSKSKKSTSNKSKSSKTKDDSKSKKSSSSKSKSSKDKKSSSSKKKKSTKKKSTKKKKSAKKDKK